MQSMVLDMAVEFVLAIHNGRGEIVLPLLKSVLSCQRPKSITQNEDHWRENSSELYRNKCRAYTGLAAVMLMSLFTARLPNNMEGGRVLSPCCSIFSGAQCEKDTSGRSIYTTGADGAGHLYAGCQTV